ncbi:MAG: acyl carrier protein [Actinomycetota bacterium]|nr:acyl carrier protein [Actinomycetota bacterium]
MDTIEQIRQIIEDHARLPMPVSAQSLRDRDDLYQAGMSSHASVNVMLALENGFDIEFPDSMLKRSVFESIDSIAVAIGELQATAV